MNIIVPLIFGMLYLTGVMILIVVRHRNQESNLLVNIPLTILGTAALLLGAIMLLVILHEFWWFVGWAAFSLIVGVLFDSAMDIPLDNSGKYG